MYNTYQYSLYAGYAGNYSVYGYYYPTYNQPIYSPYLYNYNDYYYYQPVTPQQTTSSSKKTKTKELKRSKRNYNNQTNVKEPIKHISSTNQQQNSEIITRFQKDSTFLSLKNELKKINKNSTFQKDFSSIPPVKLTNNLQKIDKFQATQTSTNYCSQPIPEPIQTRCTQFIEPKNNCSSECTESNKILPSYVSKIEQAILNSTEPITTESFEVIEVNGVRGIWLNKSEVESWQGEIPLTDYEINNDSDPEIVKLKHANCTERVQQCEIKYLRPPKPPTPGPIIIKQKADYPTSQILISQIKKNSILAPPNTPNTPINVVNLQG